MVLRILLKIISKKDEAMRYEKAAMKFQRLRFKSNIK